MNRIRSILAVFLAGVLCAPAGLAQEAAAQPSANLDKPQVPTPPGSGFFSGITRPYREPEIPGINLENSNRLESLIRAGNIYLSLQDTIAIALENNLDLELSRYDTQFAHVDLLRAQAGGLLRGVPTSIRNVSGSAASQTGAGGGQGTGSTGGTDSGDSGVGGTVITQTGTAIPTYDPQIFASTSYFHSTALQANAVTSGGRASVPSDGARWNFGYQQSFATGTDLSYTWNNTYVDPYNPGNQLSPSTAANMNIQITQRLLQGFGLAVNNRNIRVAKNNVQVSDLAFKQQVMTTVSGVVNLYWDLVSFNQDVKVRKQALDVAEKFLSDNKKQVEIGTLAPIEIVRAEARVAQAQVDLTNAETSVLQQETIIKNALSRTGTASPTIADAHIIPTDTLTQPSTDIIDPLKDLVDRALANRPDLERTRIQIENTKIAMAGSKSQLLPSLIANASATNNGLTGTRNALNPIANPDPYFIGGYGNALAQIFRRNFPDYSVSLQLNIPLRNRSAQADYIRDQLQFRQQQLNQQKQINDLRVTVQNALIAVTQAKVRYESAVKERQLQEQTLDAENRKYALGASTAFTVVSTQRDLAQAQAAEVAALAAYSRARVQLDLNTAQVLERYNVSVDEAKMAKSSVPIKQN